MSAKSPKSEMISRPTVLHANVGTKLLAWFGKVRYTYQNSREIAERSERDRARQQHH